LKLRKNHIKRWNFSSNEYFDNEDGFDNEDENQTQTIDTNLLSQYGIRSLWYITHIDNLESILTHGILSRDECRKLPILFSDISEVQVQERRKKYHNYVPLFLADNTPMLYVVVCDYGDDIILLELSNKILLLDGVKISDGNVACAETKVYDNITNTTLKMLNWSIIYSRKIAYSPEWKRVRSAEILVPKNVESKIIRLIHVRSKRVMNDVNKILKRTESVNVVIDLTENGI